jgi:hypothetical protein
MNRAEIYRKRMKITEAMHFEPERLPDALMLVIGCL